MSRKTNVETVPDGFQKTQLLKASLIGKFRIFAALVDESGTGSRHAPARAQEALPTPYVCYHRA